MPKIEQNAPGFKYKVHYKVDKPGKTWNIEEIQNWKQGELLVENTGTLLVMLIKSVWYWSMLSQYFIFI